MNTIKKTLTIFFIACTLICQAQVDTTSISPKQRKTRLIAIGASSAILYSAAIVGMNELWYKKSNQSSFHFFNDNSEWQQVDKLGHFYTAFQISHAGNKIFEWAGLGHKKAAILGAAYGFLAMTPIEILDGFSKDFGASWGDIIANTTGSGLALSQELLWNEIRIQPKFSFHQTSYAPLRPDVLGSNLSEEILKDYNGQTYWLSVDIYSFLKEESKFPKWLNVALGYGAEDMISADTPTNKSLGLAPYRQFFFALDFDWKYIPTDSKALKSVFHFLNFIHLPSPTIQLNKHGLKVHALYF